MPEKKQQVLKAILFCDIEGYTALMQKDEKKALDIVRKFQSILKFDVSKHEGEVVNFYGDGALCIFPTNSLAIRCAISMNNKFQEDSEIPVRLGIHSGTIHQEGNKVFGDAINIASRIESMGVPGSILYSKKVRDEIKNHPELTMHSLGYFDFKNIDEPIEVYALSGPQLVIPSRKELKGKFKSTSSLFSKPSHMIGLLFGAILTIGFLWKVLINDQPAQGNFVISSIAIFPFNIASEEHNSQYLGDGVAENLINALSNQSNIKVLSKYSSFALRDSLSNISSLSSILGVDAFLVGDCAVKEDLIDLEVELISRNDLSRLWGKKLSGNINDLPSLEKKLLNSLLDKFLEKSVAEYKDKKVNPEAYKHYMMGRFLSYASTEREIDLAIKHFMDALEIDPDYAPAYAGLANLKFAQARFSNTSRQELLREAKLAISNAKRLDPDLPETHLAEANIKFYGDFDWQGARNSFNQALEIDPENPSILADFAFFECAMNNYTEAVVMAEKAIEFDPVSISTMHALGWAYLYEHPDKASNEFQKTIDLYPNWKWGYIKKGMAEILLDNCDAASKLFEKGDEVSGEWGGELLETYLSVLNRRCGNEKLADEKMNFVLAHIDSHGLEDPINLAILYGGYGDFAEMMNYFRKCVDENSLNTALLQLPKGIHMFPTDFFTYPAYMELLRELGFPNN